MLRGTSGMYIFMFLDPITIRSYLHGILARLQSGRHSPGMVDSEEDGEVPKVGAERMHIKSARHALGDSANV